MNPTTTVAADEPKYRTLTELPLIDLLESIIGNLALVGEGATSTRLLARVTAQKLTALDEAGRARK